MRVQGSLLLGVKKSGFDATFLKSEFLKSPEDEVLKESALDAALKQLSMLDFGCASPIP